MNDMYVENKPKPQPTIGTHTARCFSIVDVGTQKVAFEGQEKFLHQVRFDWELPEEVMEDGRPFTIGREYTLSFGKNAALTDLIQSWKGADISKGYALATLLSEPCNITVVHNEKGYAKIASVAPLKKNEVAPPQVNKSRRLWLASYKHTDFEALPDFLKEKIKLSPEYQEIINPTSRPVSSSKAAEEAPADLEDEIPF